MSSQRGATGPGLTFVGRTEFSTPSDSDQIYLNRRVTVQKDTGGRNRSEATRRAFEILRTFTSVEPRLATVQIAKRTGLPLPTTYRYVSLLRDMGLLLADSEGRLYLSPTFIALGHVAESADTVIDHAVPFMTELGSQCNETVLLLRLIGDRAVCVYRIDSPHRLRISFQPGQALPVEHGASGKILLTSLAPAELAAQIERVAATDPLHAEKLGKEVAQAAVQGWATSEEEIDEGFWAMSAAIRSRGQTVAALSVTVPLLRATADNRKEISLAVRSTASEIGALLSHGSA